MRCTWSGSIEPTAFPIPHCEFREATTGNFRKRIPHRRDKAFYASSNDGLNPFQLVRPGLQPNLDGNTVDGDVERAAYGRAALEYRASMGFVESKVRSMLTAITGQ